MDVTRKCCICKITKLRTDFRYRNRARGWLQSFCKSCNNEQKKQAYWRNPEKAKRIAKEWYHNNKEQYKETVRKYRETHREEIKVRWRNRWLKKYGLDISSYEEMLANQGGVCLLCRRSPKDKRLAVDHCHDSNKVRGLLCDWCNRALGSIEKFGGTEWLQRATEHLTCPRLPSRLSH